MLDGPRKGEVQEFGLPVAQRLIANGMAQDYRDLPTPAPKKTAAAASPPKPADG